MIFVTRDVPFNEHSIQPLAEFKIKQAKESHDVFEDFLPITFVDADIHA